MRSALLASVLLALAASLAQAHEYQAGGVTIGHPHARPTAPGQPTGGGYMMFVNKGPADRLLSASAPVASSVQLHSMQMEGDVMRMREVDAIDLPAGKTVELKPGGLHLMFVGLKAPFAPGQKIPVKLRFEKAGEVTVEMSVDSAVAPPMAHDMR